MAKFANAKGIELVSIISIYAQQAHQVGLQFFNNLENESPDSQEFLEILKIACEKIKSASKELEDLVL